MKLSSLALAALLSSSFLVADDNPVQQVKDFAKTVGGIEAPSCISCSSINRSVVTIQKINSKTREITFKNNEGKLTVYKAPASMKNFKQLKVGDQVTTTVTIETDIQVTRGALETKARVVKESLSKARLGLKPGVKFKKEVVNQAKVIDLDYTTKSVTLESMHGKLTITPHNIEHFRILRVGDIVDAITDKTIEINVTEPAVPLKQ